MNEFCEFLTVFRNGKHAGTARVGDLPEEEIVRMIIGRSLSATYPPRENTVRADETPRLAARGLSTGGRLHKASFDFAPAEVPGVSGLQGMGIHELFPGCFGAAPPDDGHVEINGNAKWLAGTAAGAAWRNALGRRWTEARSSRVGHKHLLALQPAISENQTNQIRSPNLQLVVPTPIQPSYRESQRAWLTSVADFIKEMQRRQS